MSNFDSVFRSPKHLRGLSSLQKYKSTRPYREKRVSRGCRTVKMYISCNIFQYRTAAILKMLKLHLTQPCTPCPILMKVGVSSCYGAPKALWLKLKPEPEVEMSCQRPPFWISFSWRCIVISAPNLARKYKMVSTSRKIVKICSLTSD